MNRRERRLQARTAPVGPPLRRPDRSGQIEALLVAAVGHHRAGRLAEAEAGYRQVLSTEPRQADALHLLGVLAQQVGQSAEAVRLIEGAVAVRPGVADYHANLGAARQALGELEAAVGHYRRAIELQPDHAQAHGNLGGALKELGQLEAAEVACRRAILLDPRYVDAHNNLGNVLRECGDLAGAIEAYRQALALSPELAAAHCNLAGALAAAEQAVAAEACYRQALVLAPDLGPALSGLGHLLYRLGRPAEAVEPFRRLVELHPEQAEAVNNLGNALLDSGQAADAERCYRRALTCQPDHALAAYNLGNALYAQGQLEPAVAAYGRAIDLQPAYARAHYNLGVALQDLGRHDDAIAAYRAAVAADPAFAEALNNLSMLLREIGRLEEAVAAARAAIERRPDYAYAHNNLGNALLASCQLEAALAAYRRAAELDPNYREPRDNYLFGLLYSERHTPAEVYAEHRRWGEAEAGRRGPAGRVRFRNGAEPERRLRVGYVSGDFRRHAVAYAFLPLLRGHDRGQVEVVLYSNTRRPDGLTAELRGLADGWREIWMLDDRAAAEQVRADGVDVLVDLGCHTAGNRLGVFGERAAPVQVTHGVMTSGLGEMDYLLSDRVLGACVGAGQVVERVVRLGRCWTAYEAPAEAPGVGELPAVRSGRVTYGSFNNLAKVGPRTVGLWARVLGATAGSRLVLKGSQPVDRGTAERLAGAFEAAGVEAGRVEVRGPAGGLGQHLGTYGEVDIGLDPHPFTGYTTTCEALWMGVPVVTLAGEGLADRGGAALLAGVGLGELVAGSEAEYVGLAAGLAGELERLGELRRTLRGRVAGSELCDGRGYARAVEAAYRACWRAWCQRAAAATS